MAPAALLLAVVGVALGVWALVSASSSSQAAKLPGDPKTRVCTAYQTVSKAVAAQTHADLGQDPVALSAVAANARLALLGGGQYLIDNLDSQTPAELADAVRSFGQNLQDIGIHALAGVPNSDQEQSARMTQGDVANQQLQNLCK